MYTIVEGLFFLDILVTFFQEYRNEQEDRNVRELDKIALNYFKSDLIFDVLAIVPWTFMSDQPLDEFDHDAGTKTSYETIYFTFLFKLLRLKTASEVLDPAYFTRFVKLFFNSNRKRKIA